MEPSSLSTRPAPPSSWRGGGDHRLARQAARGDEQAFAAIFSRHHEALFRYCRSIVGNEHDATDALQNTMVKALEKLPGETRHIALRPWLFRIAHNESIDLLRARRPHADLDAAVDVSDRVSSTELETRQRLHALEADLQRLTQQQRSALLLRELVGLSFAETAGALGITASAAKQSVYEARQALHTREEGRAMDCDALCRSLSDGDRRTLRGKAVKAHLESCSGCRAFEAALRRRPTDLGLLAPLPAAGGLGGLGILGASAAGTAGVGAGAAAGGGGFLGGVLPGLSATIGTKVAAALAVGAVAVGGVAVVERGGDGVAPGPDAAEAAQEGAGGPAGDARNGAGTTGATGDAARDERGVAGETVERSGLRGAADRREGAGAGDDGTPSAAEPRGAAPNADTPADATPGAATPAAATTRDDDPTEAPARDASEDGGSRDASGKADEGKTRPDTAKTDSAEAKAEAKAAKAKADKTKADKAKADKAKADKAEDKPGKAPDKADEPRGNGGGGGGPSAEPPKGPKGAPSKSEAPPAASAGAGPDAAAAGKAGGAGNAGAGPDGGSTKGDAGGAGAASAGSTPKGSGASNGGGTPKGSGASNGGGSPKGNGASNGGGNADGRGQPDDVAK